MRKIEPPRLRPIEPEFVSVASGRNVRMAAGRTSGFTRIETEGIFPPRPTLRSDSSSNTSSSASDSTLKRRIPLFCVDSSAGDDLRANIAEPRESPRASFQRQKTRSGRREPRGAPNVRARRRKQCRNRFPSSRDVSRSKDSHSISRRNKSCAEVFPSPRWNSSYASVNRARL